MYTLTVKIAARGTIYTNPETNISHPSDTGHMWYSLSGVENSAPHTNLCMRGGAGKLPMQW